MLARGALVILSLFVAGFWSEVDCAGLLSGAMGQCEEIHFSRRPWTRPRQGFRHAQENCDRRHRRRSLERTHLALLCKVWSSLRSSASCLGQPLLRIESQRGPFWMWFARVVSFLSVFGLLRLILVNQVIDSVSLKLDRYDHPVIWSCPKNMTHWIEHFLQKKDSKNVFEKKGFKNMSQRIEPFSNTTQRIEPFFLWIRRKELNPFLNMTQRIELFVNMTRKNWTSFWVWFKELNLFLSMTQKIELFFWIRLNESNPFFWMWLKKLKMLFYITQRIEPLFSIWLKELNLFRLDSKIRCYSVWPQELNFFLTRTDRIGPFFLNMT